MRSEAPPSTSRPTSAAPPRALTRVAASSGGIPSPRAIGTRGTRGENTGAHVAANTQTRSQNARLRRARRTVHARSRERDAEGARAGGSPSGARPLVSGSRRISSARTFSETAIARPKATYAQRQPRRLTRRWATGGSANVPRLPPALASPTASPRRRVNHLATVALHGTYAVDMPRAPMVP